MASSAKRSARLARMMEKKHRHGRWLQRDSVRSILAAVLCQKLHRTKERAINPTAISRHRDCNKENSGRLFPLNPGLAVAFEAEPTGLTRAVVLAESRGADSHPAVVDDWASGHGCAVVDAVPRPVSSRMTSTSR